MEIERPEQDKGDIIQSTVESVVLDWLNKYPLESHSGHLSVADPNNKDQVRVWVSGVWGRITHQLKDSGLPVDNNKILNLARKVFNTEIAKHPWYELIKDDLPKPPQSTGWLEAKI